MNLNPVNTIVLFGIGQSIVVNLLILLTDKRKQKHNVLLVFFSIALSFSLVPFFVGNSDLIELSEAIRFIPMDGSLFLFPLLYFYLSIIFQKDFKFKTNDMLHMLVPVLFGLFYFVVWVFTLSEDAGQKQEVAGSLYYFEARSLHQLVLVALVGFYSFKSFRLLSTVERQGLPREKEGFLKWARFLLPMVTFGLLMEVLAFFIGEYYDYWNGSPLDDWLGMPFTLLIKVYYAILVYIVGLVGYAHFSHWKPRKPIYTTQDTDKLLPKVVAAMEEDKLYLRPDLTMQLLAAEVDATPVMLSSVLNSEMRMPYNDFVNRYRVEEVKKRLETEDVQRFTLLAIAKEAGFKSKTTFYRAFQKFEQDSPKAYLEKLKKN